MGAKEFSTEDVKKELESAWKSRLEIYVKREKLRAKIVKLCAEGNKLRSEGKMLWLKTIIKYCGNIEVEWKLNKDMVNYDCHLETGEVFYWENIDE